MRAIVTGSAGFIGSHLVDSLLIDGWEVVGIDDLSAGTLKNLKSAVKNRNFTQVHLDICSKKINALFNKIDVVFHNAASKKNVCLNNPHRDLKVNAGGTLNLLQIARKHNVKKFVHASTGSVYGEPTVFPQDENHPLNPCSFYGVSKLAGERYVSMYNKIFDLNTTILRYFHVFGRRQDSTDEKGGVVSIFLRKAKENKPLIIYGSGNQQRSFTSVDDIVRANKFVAENETYGETYNIASGMNVTIKELADTVIRLTNSKSKIIRNERLVGDIDRFEVDNSKIKKMGFVFRTDLVNEISNNI